MEKNAYNIEILQFLKLKPQLKEKKDQFESIHTMTKNKFRENIEHEVYCMKNYNLRIEQEYVTNLICSKEIATPEWCVI